MQIKRSILIVDDNKLLTDALQILLEDDGHTVICCHNGLDAIELSKKQNFDVVLTDYRMTDMKGDVVCKLLRFHRPDVFLIGCSTDNQDKDFLRAGADIFIRKDQLVQDLPLLMQSEITDRI
ncbi:MAG TPA: response regulator [Nitrospirota bacterium]|nr:response regulator [Nitrospirota bacterium]